MYGYLSDDFFQGLGERLKHHNITDMELDLAIDYAIDRVKNILASDIINYLRPPDYVPPADRNDRPTYDSEVLASAPKNGNPEQEPWYLNMVAEEERIAKEKKFFDEFDKQ